jgi:hypothetical protein
MVASPNDQEDLRKILAAVEYIPPGTPAPAPGPAIRGFSLGDVTIDAETAVKRLQSRYQQLSAAAAQLAPIANLVPCAVIDAYQRAVHEYRLMGRDVFAELDRNKLQMAQIVYKDGQPVPDPNNPGQYVTRTLSAPLSPPVFVASSFTRCPGLFDVYNPSGLAGSFGHAMSVNLGIAPLLIWGGVIVVSLLGTAVALNQLRFVIHGENPKPAETVNAYLDCFTKLRAGGATAEAATAGCTGAANAGQGAGTGGIAFTSLAIGAVAVASLAGLAYLLFSRRSDGGSQVHYLPAPAPAPTAGSFEGGCGCY